jgi:hypothetical protein
MVVASLGARRNRCQRDSVIAALRDRGCHQTDIGEAFCEAGPEWLLRP